MTDPGLADLFQYRAMSGTTMRPAAAALSPTLVGGCGFCGVQARSVWPLFCCLDGLVSSIQTAHSPPFMQF